MGTHDATSYVVHRPSNDLGKFLARRSSETNLSGGSKLRNHPQRPFQTQVFPSLQHFESVRTSKGHYNIRESVAFNSIAQPAPNGGKAGRSALSGRDRSSRSLPAAPTHPSRVMLLSLSPYSLVLTLPFLHSRGCFRLSFPQRPSVFLQPSLRVMQTYLVFAIYLFTFSYPSYLSLLNLFFSFCLVCFS